MVRFYYFAESDNFAQEIPVQIEGYSEEDGELTIHARTDAGVSVADGIEVFTVEKPGKFSRPLGYRDLHHFSCLSCC